MIERSQVRVPTGAAGQFSSSGSTFCADSYFSVCSTPVLLQQHVKDPGHSAKSAGGRLQINTPAPYSSGFAWRDVMWCMVVWCAWNMLSSFMWHQPCYNQTAPWVDCWICKTCYKKLQSLVQNLQVQELCESWGGRPGLSVLTSGRKAILNHASALVSAGP